MTEPRAAIVGIAGLALAATEAVVLREHPPAGVILFGRNVRDREQLAALVAALRAVLPAKSVLMIDQEGGRVARLRPPDWLAHPAMGAIGALHDVDPDAAMRAAWLTGALIGSDCAGVGLGVVCAPVLDLRAPGVTDAIGDRAAHIDPEVVARLGRAVADGLLAAGIQPVGKHAPGHGRARVDSHHALPVVTQTMLDDDVAPFAANRDLPWMMTAHILYTALDPVRPATLSPTVIADIIRGGPIGFDGVLCSDDLAMAALDGPPAARACAALAAGCDIALYCPGDPAGTLSVLACVPSLTPEAQARLDRAAALAQVRRLALDPGALIAERNTLLP